MKKSMLGFSGVVVVAVSGFSMSVAYATSLYGGATGNVQLGTGAGATLQASTSVQLQGQQQAQNTTGSIVGLQAQVQAGMVSASSDDSVVELQGDSANFIQANNDLMTYDDLVIQARPAVTSINANGDGSVDVGYSQPAKFLGMFSTSISGDVNVDAQGNTTVRLPWWSFLYSKDTSGVQAVAASAVQNSGASFNAQAGTTTELQDQARVVNAVSAAIQAQVSANASASGNY